MTKVKKVISSMFISFAMILIAVLSVLSFNPSQAKDIFSSADIESYNSIVNDLPEFFEIYRSNRTSGDESEVGYVGNTINLFQTGAFKKVTIADKTVEGSNFTPATEYDPSKTYYSYSLDAGYTVQDGVTAQDYTNYFVKETNYAYFPNAEDENTYYYFDFQNSLSLYYDLTNEDIQVSGKTGVKVEKLMKLWLVLLACQ